MKTGYVFLVIVIVSIIVAMSYNISLNTDNQQIARLTLNTTTNATKSVDIIQANITKALKELKDLNTNVNVNIQAINLNQLRQTEVNHKILLSIIDQLNHTRAEKMKNMINDSKGNQSKISDTEFR